MSRNGLLFIVIFLVALVVAMPLRLALDWVGLDGAGLAAREARGSVWAGRLTEASFAGLELGDLSAGLSPFQLPLLRVRVDFARDDQFQGAMTMTRSGFGIDDTTAILPAGQLFAPLPIGGLDLNDVSLRFANGQCVQADGGVRATLSGDVAGMSLAQGFAGTARCEGGRLLLLLTSPSGGERLSLRLSAEGTYEAELGVQAVDPAGVERLTAAGFIPGNDGYMLAVTGRLR